MAEAQQGLYAYGAYVRITSAMDGESRSIAKNDAFSSTAQAIPDVRISIRAESFKRSTTNHPSGCNTTTAWRISTR